MAKLTFKRVLVYVIVYGLIQPIWRVMFWYRSYKLKRWRFKRLSDAKLKSLMADKLAQLHDEERPYFQHERHQPIATPDASSWLSHNPEAPQDFDEYLRYVNYFNRRCVREQRPAAPLTLPVAADAKIYLCLLDADVFDSVTTTTTTNDSGRHYHDDDNGNGNGNDGVDVGNTTTTPANIKVNQLAEYISVWFQRQVVILTVDQLHDFDINQITSRQVDIYYNSAGASNNNHNTEADRGSHNPDSDHHESGGQHSTSHKQLLTADIHKYLVSRRSQLPDCFAMLAVTKLDLYGTHTSFVFGETDMISHVGVISTYQTSLKMLIAALDHDATERPTLRSDETDDCLRLLQPLRSQQENTEQGRLATVSSHSSSQQLLQLTDNKELLLKYQLQLICAVAVHELNHMLGMGHCVYYACNMNGWNHLAELAEHPMHLCPIDLYKLKHAMAIDNIAVRQRQLQEISQRLQFIDEL